jgi:hypothetical protein
MRCSIAHTGGRAAAYEYGGGAFYDYIRRPYTGNHIAHYSGGHHAY